MPERPGHPPAGRYAGLVILAVLAAVALYVVFGEGLSATGSDPEVFRSALDQNECVWWTHLGMQGAAVLNLGPMLSSRETTVRRYSLVVHLSDSGEPLSCIQGIVPSTDRNPIGVRGGGFEVELLPADGLGWGDVRTSGQIRAVVSGFGELASLER